MIWVLVRTIAALHWIAVAASAADWPEFRGPTADGISTAANVPTEWNDKSNVAWKQRIPGTGWSSPVLVGGKLYLTTATGKAVDGNVALRALCVDAATGDIVWNVEVFQPDTADARQMHDKNSLASATPIVAGDRLYVHFGHMGTAALDLQGNVLWRQNALKYAPEHGNGGSPALVDGLIVFSCDGVDQQFIAALDQTTGEVRWKVPRVADANKTFSFCTPTIIDVDGAKQIISPGSGMVGAYDPKDGREIWRVNYGDGFSVVPRPVYAHGRLYVCSGFMRANLICIDPHGAQGDVTDTRVIWKYDRGVPTTPSVLVVDNEVYFASDNGVITCLDAHTGEMRWTDRLGGNYSASPIFADGRIYFLSEEGITSVLKAGPEFKRIAENKLDERALASPIPDDDTLYIRTAKHLWRIAD